MVNRLGRLDQRQLDQRRLTVCLTLGVFVLFCVSAAQAESLDEAGATAFLQGLLNNFDPVEQFICPEDQKFAQRLGISYAEEPDKELISWGLPPQVALELTQRGISGQFVIEKTDGETSRLVLFPNEDLISRSWYFEGEKLVSSILQQTKDWQVVESEHFRFLISDPTLFNEANVQALESFLSNTARLLEMTPADMERLAREKIYYCFCNGQDEIRQLTGYAARGMYIVSHDIIVSTYSAHFHELAHLLINYKLKQPHLYTHPLLLEGFAVAVGGRGGKTPDIIKQLGLFLYRSDWLSVADMLVTSGFYQQNVSLSYPASAPYNDFLMKHLGTKRYLKLYHKYGGDQQTVVQLKIDPADLPDEADWQKYLSQQTKTNAIGLVPEDYTISREDKPVVMQPLIGGRAYGFQVPGTYLFSVPSQTTLELPDGYRSLLLADLAPTLSYSGEQFLIRASQDEVGVYDLYTNTMIAHYAASFSENPIQIPQTNGRYIFQVDSSIFPFEIK